jgi:hypothetical protein
MYFQLQLNQAILKFSTSPLIARIEETQILLSLERLKILLGAILWPHYLLLLLQLFQLKAHLLYLVEYYNIHLLLLFGTVRLDDSF